MKDKSSVVETYIARWWGLPKCEASVQVNGTLDPLLDVRLGCVWMLGLVCLEGLHHEFDSSLPEGESPIGNALTDLRICSSMVYDRLVANGDVRHGRGGR